MERFFGSSLAARTVGFLREQIVSGAWPVGQAIPTEPELMGLVGVGKSTIREAVRSLANLGMLETVPGTGTFVRSASPIPAITATFAAAFPASEALIVRRAIEVEAAGLAATHRLEADLAALSAAVDADWACHALPSRWGRVEGFHLLVVAATHLPLLIDSYQGLLQGMPDEGWRTPQTEPAARRAGHAAILAAIRAGDSTAAAEAIRAHLSGASPSGDDG